ncbi:unnamed protein product, partial [Meganyctiphanes norvegica]
DFASLLRSSDLTTAWDASAHTSFNSSISNLTQSFLVEDNARWLPPHMRIWASDDAHMPGMNLEGRKNIQTIADAIRSSVQVPHNTPHSTYRPRRSPQAFMHPSMMKQMLRRMPAPNRRSGYRKPTTTTTTKRPPIIFVPEDKPECIKTPQMSSFGFISFMMAVANIVINIANNINNNNNNNNQN